MPKISVLSRCRSEHSREKSTEPYRLVKNPDPVLHPFAREREYIRALNATKLDRVFAKPFIGAMSGHIDGVCSVVRHPTRVSCIASGDYTGVFKLWNLSSRECIGTTAAHSMAVNGICFAPNGKSCFTAGNDKVVKQWSVEFDLFKTDALRANSMKAPIMTFLGDEGFTSIDHCPHSTKFVTSSHKVQVWDEQRSSPLRSYEWGSETISCVRYNPVERDIIASCAGDRSVCLYDVRADTPIKKVILEHRNNCIAWNPMISSNFVVASDDTNCYCFDMRKLDFAKNVYKDHVSAVMSIAFAPTGKEFVTGSFDRTVRIFPVLSGHSREVYYTKRMQRVLGVEFSADSRFVISASDDANLRLWKAQASEPMKILTNRERDHLSYHRQLLRRYAHVPELARIARHRHVPKAVLIAKRQLHEIRQSKHRKLETKVKRSGKNGVEIEPERSKHIVNTLE